MKPYDKANEMLIMVAKALGDDLLKEVAFIGGCTTGLLLTDEVEQVTGFTSGKKKHSRILKIILFGNHTTNLSAIYRDTQLSGQIKIL